MNKNRLPFFLTSILLLAWSSILNAGPNILIITVDDMSCDSVGVYGCPLKDTTPHMDKLANSGLRFQMAHVQVGNCYPSRNVMFSGRYPHNSGVEGFYQVNNDYPVMCDVMQKAGYYVGIRGKVSHSTPNQPYKWDDDLTINEDGSKAHIKDVPSYYESTKRGIKNAEEAGKPFVLNINISDPHKPFWKPNDKHPASKVYTAAEVPIPGFLWDDEKVREELALYYTSVRRADDAVGAILKALDDSGKTEETVVMFLSDHGMPLPFAKTQLYHHSTWTPWMVRWPGVTKPNSIDTKHMISAIDMLPTLCDIVKTDIPDGVQGKSFAAAIKGETLEGRDSVFKEYNENSGGVRHPIRAVQTPGYLYLFNPWSNGERACKTATQGTATYKQMKAVAPSNPQVAARLKMFDHRTVEELYDVVADPDCLNNLVGQAAHAGPLEELQGRLEAWMKETEDPMLAAFQIKDEAEKLDSMMEKIEEEAAARRAERRKKKAAEKKKNQGKGKSGQTKKKSTKKDGE